MTPVEEYINAVWRRTPRWKKFLRVTVFLSFWMLAILCCLGFWAGVIWVAVKLVKCAWGA